MQMAYYCLNATFSCCAVKPLLKITGLKNLMSEIRNYTTTRQESKPIYPVILDFSNSYADFYSATIDLVLLTQLITRYNICVNDPA